MEQRPQLEGKPKKLSGSLDRELKRAYTQKVSSEGRKRKKSNQLVDDGKGYEEKRKAEEHKKARRRAANRISASRSRQRFKDLVTELSKSVEELAKSNAELRAEGNELSGKLKVAMLENQLLKQDCLGVTPPPPTADNTALAKPAPLLLPQQTIIPPKVVNPIASPPVLNYAVLHSALGVSGQGYQAGFPSVSQGVVVTRQPSVVQSQCGQLPLQSSTPFSLYSKLLPIRAPSLAQ